MSKKEDLKKIGKQTVEQYMKELDKTIIETTDTLSEIINSLPEEARRPLLATIIHKIMNKTDLDFYTKIGVLDVVKNFAQMTAYDTAKEREMIMEKQGLYQ